MFLEINKEINKYYKNNPQLFNDLVKIVINNQFNYTRTINAYRKDLVIWINDQVPLLSDNFYKLSTKIHWIINGITEFPKCKICGDSEHFKKLNISLYNHYKEHCSLKCAYSDEMRDIHREQTSLKKYGFKSAMCLKETLEKRKTTNIRKYGCPHPLQSKQIKMKIKQKYGHECILWGTKQREKAINTLQKNYNVSNPSQSKEIRRRQSYKYFYDGRKFDSGDEVRFYIYLKDNGMNFEYQPKICFQYSFNGKNHKYFPDFIVDGKYIEIKGDHFFREDGTMFYPWRKKEWSDDQYNYLCNLVREKQLCMERNSVKIIKTNSEEFKKIKIYVDIKYGKTFIKQCKNNQV